MNVFPIYIHTCLFDGDSNRFLYLMNEHMICKVYNIFWWYSSFYNADALNEIIVIIETNSNGPRVMVMKPKNSNHPVNYCYLDRYLCLIKHMDHHDACVPLNDRDPIDTRLIAKTVPAPEDAAKIFKWDCPYLGDLRYKYCHVCHNLKCM